MRRKECGKDGCLWRHGAAFSIGLQETGTDLRLGPQGIYDQTHRIPVLPRSLDVLNIYLIMSRFGMTHVLYKL